MLTLGLVLSDFCANTYRRSSLMVAGCMRLRLCMWAPEMWPTTLAAAGLASVLWLPCVPEISDESVMLVPVCLGTHFLSSYGL